MVETRPRSEVKHDVNISKRQSLFERGGKRGLVERHKKRRMILSDVLRFWHSSRFTHVVELDDMLIRLTRKSMGLNGFCEPISLHFRTSKIHDTPYTSVTYLSPLESDINIERKDDGSHSHRGNVPRHLFSCFIKGKSIRCNVLTHSAHSFRTPA